MPFCIKSISTCANNATQAYAEQGYHRKVHREIGTTPLQRMIDGPSLARPAPDSQTLHLTFTRKPTRTPRRSDATVVVDGSLKGMDFFRISASS